MLAAPQKPDPVLVWAITLRMDCVFTPALNARWWPQGAPVARAPANLVTMITGIFTSVVEPNVNRVSASLATISATAPRPAATQAKSRSAMRYAPSGIRWRRRCRGALPHRLITRCV
jgi:hypothetical protein